MSDPTHNREFGYAESVARGAPVRQTIVFQGRDGLNRLLSIPGILTIDQLLSLVKDIRNREANFRDGGEVRPSLA